MTSHDDSVYLREMLDHAQEAVAYTANLSTTDVARDRILTLALIRLLEVVGEAATRVTQETRSHHPEIQWSQVIALRNRLIHGYDAVDMAIVWTIIQRDLPPLIENLDRIIRPTE